MGPHTTSKNFVSPRKASKFFAARLPLNEKFSIIYLMEESGSPAVERATLALI